jgi:hypothetical protein
MKKASIVLLILLIAWATPALAQNNETSAESIDELKLQLIDLGALEEEAKVHSQQLDEGVEAENIENSLAGYGLNRRPEELREQRRKELTAEKAVVTDKLQLLALKRTQLEAAISSAEVRAYQQSASGMVENYLGLRVSNFFLKIGMILMAVVFVFLGTAGFVIARQRTHHRM